MAGDHTRVARKQKASEVRSCVNVEVAVLGSPPLIVCTVSVDTELKTESGSAHGRKVRLTKVWRLHRA